MNRALPQTTWIHPLSIPPPSSPPPTHSEGFHPLPTRALECGKLQVAHTCSHLDTSETLVFLSTLLLPFYYCRAGGWGKQGLPGGKSPLSLSLIAETLLAPVNTRTPSAATLLALIYLPPSPSLPLTTTNTSTTRCYLAFESNIPILIVPVGNLPDKTANPLWST